MKRIFYIFAVLLIMIGICGADNITQSEADLMPPAPILSDENSPMPPEPPLTSEEITGFLAGEISRWENRIITNEWIGKGKNIPDPSEKTEGTMEKVAGKAKKGEPQFKVSAGIPFRVHMFNETELITNNKNIFSSVIPTDIWYVQIFINNVPSSIIKIDAVSRRRLTVAGYGLQLLSEMLAGLGVSHGDSRKFVMSSDDDSICFIADEVKNMLYLLPLTKRKLGISELESDISPDTFLYRIQEKKKKEDMKIQGDY